MTIEKKTWFEISIYFIIATSLSAVFKLGLFNWYNNIALPFGLTAAVKTLLEGIGPITAALVILAIKNKKSSSTLF